MRKLYLLATSVVLVGGVSAQQLNLEKNDAKMNPDQVRIMPRQMVTESNRVGGTIVWTEDFANGLTGNNPSGAWTTSGTDGSVWMADTDGPNGLYSDPAVQIIQSSTAANGFMIFDADYENNQNDPLLGSNATQWEGSLVSPVIDMSATPCVLLEWTQAMRWCCYGSSALAIDVTTNNFGSFTTFDAKNATIVTNLFSGTETRTMNITAAIAANPSTVQVRFRWGEAGSTFNGSHYFWQIDDVNLVENYDFNHNADTVVYGASTNYYKFSEIPENHLIDFQVGGYVRNNGCQNTTNVGWEAMDDMGVVVTSTTEPTLASATFSGFLTGNNASTGWMSGSAFDLAVYPVATETEEVTSDDTLYYPVAVTSGSMGTWAAHLDVSEDVISGNDYPSAYTNGAGYGAYHEMQVADNVEGVWIAPTDSSINYGAPIQVQVWVDDGVSGNQMISSYDTILPTSNLGQFIFIPLPSAFQVAVNAGDVVNAVVRDFDGSIRVFAGGNTGGADYLGSMWEYDAAGVPTEYLAPKAPFVKLQLTGVVGIEENNMVSFLGQNVPNPFNGTSVVEFSTLENANVTFEVRDVTGKLVSAQNLGTKAAGTHTVEMDASELSSGVYFYSVSANGSTATKRMIVKK